MFRGQTECDVLLHGASLYVAEEIQWRVQHFRHHVKRENVHYERRLDNLGTLTFEKLPSLKAQCRVTARMRAANGCY
jgi:hypothetical protein